MSVHEFQTLTIADIRPETADSVRMRLEVPPPLAAEFRFEPGQHIPIEADIDGERLRRTYSLCCRPDEGLEIGIRVQPGGRFSSHAASTLKAGDQLRVMPPTGRFMTTIDAGARRHLLAFAAGSGITPILSILSSVLRGEPESTATLFYGNRTHQTTMFIEELYALKNLYPERFDLHFLFSREEQEFEIKGGRLDAAKTGDLYDAFLRDVTPDDVFICGPGTMIRAVTGALTQCGVPAERIHSERFGIPGAATERPAPAELPAGSGDVSVSVVLDGHRREFTMRRDDDNIVDAAAAAGVELPYSCKGGVCATCRTYLAAGDVRMAANYGLEPWEVEKGFILACQSRPASDKLELDYDRT